MKSNNQYYISIYETVTGTPVIGHKSDNYLLKGIAECYGYTYTGSKCDFYYLRDISHSITGITYTEFYDNNRYLQDIADELYDGTLTSKRDNYLLRIISENITSPVGIPTQLNISVPSSITWSDDYTITGVLSYTDDNDQTQYIEYANVKLYVNNVDNGSATTNSSGQVTFTKQPVDMNEHTIKLVYDGDSTYSAVTSSTAIPTVDKETSVINLETPLNNTSIYSDGSITVSGTLGTGEDPFEPITGKTITIEYGSESTTATTGNDGAFSKTITPSSSCTITVSFSGDANYYTATSIQRNVTVNPVSMSVTADKSILSYVDTDSAILTATVSATTPTGRSLNVYNGETLLGAMTDNLDGTYEYEYESQGIGDVTLTVTDGTLLIQTCVIEDCIKYWDNLPNQDTVVNYTLPSSFKIEFTLYSTSVSQNPSASFIRFNNSSGGWIGKGSNYNGTISFFGTTFTTINSNIKYNYVLTYENGVATLTNGTTTKTSSQTLTKIYTLTSWNYGKMLIVKIKPL